MSKIYLGQSVPGIFYCRWLVVGVFDSSYKLTSVEDSRILNFYHFLFFLSFLLMEHSIFDWGKSTGGKSARWYVPLSRRLITFD
jgi:hypothetical protein